ncbi:MAG: CpXC domain-containing protein [Caldilineaceae bacterium]|nr:CpXC domain-containing protein [Caldilineaceae bacterium]
MTEIWTPGSPPPSQPAGGIELPKGFSTSRRKEEETPETQSEDQAPVQPDSQEREAAAAASDSDSERERSQPELDLLFPPAGVQVTCPGCGVAYTAAVFTIVDFGANPELKPMVLGGQINTAVCSACGAGGPLSVPLMVHDPEHEFLGVVVPGQARIDDMQLQKTIGDMSQALMGRLPSDERRGYMLQPQQFFEWDSLMEKLWGFEGVTPEMLRRRREQSELIGSLIRLGSDEAAMQMVVDRNKGLVDSSFFVLLSQVINALSAEGESEQLEAILNLRNSLMETTEAGKELRALEERVQDALGKIGPGTSRNELLSLLVEYWLEGESGEAIASAVLNAAAALTDYQFLLGLADRLEGTDDPEERSALIAIRERVVEIGEQRSQSQQMAAQQVQAVLQTVLQAPDTDAALQENADQIDEMFLAVLASNIQQAEKNRAAFAVQRLRLIYQKAVAIVEERLPPELRLLNRLLAAPDEGTLRRLLQESRADLSQEFVDALKSLEERFSGEGNMALANRVKSIRGQVALLL